MLGVDRDAARQAACKGNREVIIPPDGIEIVAGRRIIDDDPAWVSSQVGLINVPLRGKRSQKVVYTDSIVVADDDVRNAKITKIRTFYFNDQFPLTWWHLDDALIPTRISGVMEQPDIRDPFLAAGVKEIRGSMGRQRVTIFFRAIQKWNRAAVETGSDKLRRTGPRLYAHKNGDQC